MPWGVKRRGDKWICYNKETGKIKGEHETKGMAVEQMKALYANVPEGRKKN